ncbi:DUF2783 domain-containing protein [Pararhodobacter oceanensis]|uniref:DUF2783 domain-containing protein n=1 Tax=Pararhodobacter oceanensis TaxID=2172121 RepID=A0A2T8HZ81_9RHOB|nr:DUF2783 domain-containing protein [Pararhodobacter oceanensis]PVH30652.1 hypothetical protein DDE20_03795 [Pararhodobacter oceanensis]
MGQLNTTRNMAQADDVYEMLIDAHEGKSKPESDAFNARLIITLINHIGDKEVIAQALAIAEG